MRISGTTLFQMARPQSAGGRKEHLSILRARLQQIGEADAGLGRALKSLNPNLRRTLVGTSYADVADVAPTKDVLGRLQRATKELTADTRVITFGLWDLNAMVGGLESLLQRLNAAQKKIAFFRIVAAIPAGLISDKERVKAWVREQHKRMTKSRLAQLEENTIFEDFYPQADKVRREMGLDYLAGITQSMVAFQAGNDIHWNYFTASVEIQRDLDVGRSLLISSYGLREYAAEAGRPFATAVGIMAVSQLLAAVSPDVQFHPEDRGCMFDFNGDRDSVVETLREARIEPECLKKIRRDLREPAVALADALRLERGDNGPRGQ
ncbi:MAG TPA: hypothetical protein VLY24_17850 [Bryobacteraceae bacterium]|nr:hypothetical protein [Bryobacteraceae bacterium]